MLVSARSLATPILAALLCAAAAGGVCAELDEAPLEAGKSYNWRWGGNDFAFCFITDDGTRCNLGFVEKAEELRFRYTVSFNGGRTAPSYLATEDLEWLVANGYELANHSYSHALTGLPTGCSQPPRGSLLGYWQCGVDLPTALVYFQMEISRSGLAARASTTPDHILTFTYPRHLHSQEVIARLEAEGYLGARTGGREEYAIFSDGEFDFPAYNTWGGGISLFRVPTMAYTTELFGDHSADPPVHFSYAEFRAVAEPLFEAARQDGGICTVFAHHYGDDDPSCLTYPYGTGGITPEELGWLVELAREYNGRVTTFGEAVSYYRSISDIVEIDGDRVWIPLTTGVPDAADRGWGQLGPCFPNPFNPRTTVHFRLDRPARLRLSVYDLAGRLVVDLARGWHAAGAHEVVWDGTDRSGAGVATGTYVVRLSGPDFQEARRLTLVR